MFFLLHLFFGVKIDKERLKEDFEQKYMGLGKLFSTLFLPPIVDEYKEMEIDPEKAQALQSRQFSITEVARWMNLPPHILKDLTRSSFNNIEEQALELVIYSFLPLVTQIEQTMNITFFDEEERIDHYIKFELKGLLRGNIAARTDFYTALLDRGVFHADDVLKLEDMNPQPDGLGQIYAMPLNMVNKKMLVSSQPLTIEEKYFRDKIQTVRVLEFRNTALRRKLTIAWKPKFEEYGKQIVTTEVDAIRAAIKKMLEEKSIVDFNAWLDTYYQEFSKEIEEICAPLIASYAAEVLPIAQEEIGSDFEIEPQYQDFQRQYKEIFIKRHIISSESQLKALMARLLGEDDDLAAALSQRIDEWEERRPGKIVMRETIRAENAFARSAFALSGITKIRSVSFGKSCPYCEELNGNVIGIEGFFLTKGDFQPEGVDEPLTVTQNCSHPPFHGGCDCGVAAET